MRCPNPRRLWIYVTRCLGLRSYWRSPGDGRRQPQIPGQALLWSLLIGQVLRACSFLAVERLVRSSARRALVVSRSFSDDALDYFTERLDPAYTRVALARVLQQAKRNKAFESSGGIGLAVDGSTVGWCQSSGCSLCRPYRNADKEIAGYRHHVVLATVVGTGLPLLPFDVEPYGSGDSEYAAGQRLLRRAGALLGVRFAAYVVVDGEFATAPFLHAAGQLGLPVVARLKPNLPELLAAAQKRFRSQPPKLTFRHGPDHVELWDAEDFDPWENLQWETVRVLRYRQQKPDGDVVEAFWLTNLSMQEVSRRVFHRAKSRWEIENQGFNDAKNRHDLEHICHHHPNSLLITWLLTSLALTIERLYRLRYLHRGKHPLRTAAEFVHLLWLSLSRPASADTSDQGASLTGPRHS